MTSCDYVELDHTTVIGACLRAPTLAALFHSAAGVLFKLLGAESGEHGLCRIVMLDSLDTESLLVDWLSELLYCYETTGQIYDQCEIVTCSPTRLTAIIKGRIPIGRPIRSIKAVTYHGLCLTEDASGWVAKVYFDV